MKAIIASLFIFLSTLVYAQNPQGMMTVPGTGFIGEQQCFPLEIENIGPTGYNPYVRLFLEPGLSFSNASLGGLPLTILNEGVLPATPIKDPKLNTGTAVDSITGPVGSTLILIELPVTSLVANGPKLNLSVCFTVDGAAPIGVPLNVQVEPVYQLGNTPTGDNGPIFGATLIQALTPILYAVTKDGPTEINPGLCHLYTYSINTDIAAAGSLNGPINIIDVLSANIQYQNNLVMPPGCVLNSAPSIIVPGGTLDITCIGVFPGSPLANDLEITYDAYIEDVLNETFCDFTTENNTATVSVPTFPAQIDSVLTNVNHLTLSHSNNAAGPTTVGSTITYTINFDLSAFTGGVNAALIDFIVPDGMVYNPASLTWGGFAVAPVNVTVVAGPGTGSTVTVDVHAENGADITTCTSPDLVYTADVNQTYASTASVLARDTLIHTSAITFGLVEGAAACVDNASSSVTIADISFNKTVNNAPPGITGEWLPGDIVQYRLELNVPGEDADDVVITDFLPLPIHDVSDLAPAFGTDVVYDVASCWILPPVGYNRNVATNGLELDFGDLSDVVTGGCVDIVLLINIPITTIPFNDNLVHSNFMSVSSNNSNLDADLVDVLTTIQVRAPALTDFQKNIVSSNNPAAVVSGGDISDVDANDTIRFELVTTNLGGAYAYDVEVRDVVPASLKNCALDPTAPSTYADATPALFTGGFVGNNLTLTLSDSLDPASLPKFASTIRYYCLVDDLVDPLEVGTNNAEMDWASDQGSTKFPIQIDSASITVNDVTINKTIITTYPSGATGNDVHIGDLIRYRVIVDIPEGELTNMSFTDQLDEGLAFTGIDSVYTNSINVTSSLAALNTFEDSATFSNVGGPSTGDDRQFDISFGDITNADIDNSITETITIEYTAAVINSTTNISGVNLNNRFDIFWDDPNSAGSLTVRDNAPNVTIVEPQLQGTKAFLDNELVPGEQTFVTLNIDHATASNATAYDVMFTDALNLGLNYVAASATVGGSHTATPIVSISGNNISVQVDSLAQGEDITLVFKVEVDVAFPICDTIPNCLAIDWESLPDPLQVGLPSGINNTFVGERTGDSTDIGGTNNNYSFRTCVDLFTTNNQAVDPNITSSGPVCENGSVTLSVQAYSGSVVDYIWSGPSVPLGFNSNVLTLNPVTFADTGNYQVIVEVDGCVSDTSQIFNLQIFQNPVATVSNNGTLCMHPDSNLTLTPTITVGMAPFSYSWTGPNGFSSPADTPIIVNPTSADAGMYFVNITDVNGCSSGPIGTLVNLSNIPVQPNLTNTGPVCEGQNISIETNTAYSGSSVNYYWEGPNGAIPQNSNLINLASITSADSGIYRLSVEVDGCQSDTTSLNIVIYQEPAPLALSVISPTCENDSLFLFSNALAGNNYSFNWTGPNSFTSSISDPVIYGATILNAGFYNLAITDTNGCNAQETIQAVINGQPQTPVFTSDNNVVCLGGNFTLTSSTSYSGTVIQYIWSKPSGLLDTTAIPTLNINTASLTDSGQYALTVIVDGCTSNSSGDVLVSIISNTMTPNITASDDTLCEGQTFSLTTTTSADTYTWTGPNGFSSSSQSPSAITASALTAGTYQLSVTVSGCGSVDTSVLIVVNPLPATPVLSATNNVCTGDSVVLTTTAVAPTYHWISPVGDTVTTTTNRLAVGGGLNYTSGNWSLITENSNGCSSLNSNIETVTILSIPTVVASNDGPVCLSSNVTLTGNTQPGGTYQWYDSAYTSLLATSSSHVVSGLGAGFYTYNFIIDVNGCVDTASTIVQVDSLQQAPNIAVSNDTLCEGQTFSLTTTTSADTYTWTGPNGFSSGSQSPPAITAGALTAGTYQLSVTVTGCGSADTSVLIVVNPLPAKPVLVATENVCSGDSVVLTTISTASSYHWISPVGDTVTTTTNRLAIGGGLNYTSGNWSLITENSNGCASLNSNIETVTILNNPNAIALNDGPVCFNGAITLTGNTLPGASYLWYDSAYTILLATVNTHMVSGLAGGLYTYNYIIDVNGCTDTASTIVQVDSLLPAPNISTSIDTLCVGQTFNLATSTSADVYLWSGPNGFSSNSQYPVAITANLNTAGTYQLYYIENGCESADTSITIVVETTPVTPVLVATNNLCIGDSIILTTTAIAPTYLWLSPIGDTVTTTVNRLAIGGGTHYISGNWSLVTVNINDCASLNSNIETVTLNSIPTAIASNNGPICLIGDVTLMGNTLSGASYQWYDSAYTTLLATSNSHVISGLSAGFYTYNYIINLNGCVDTSSTIVQVDSQQLAPNISVNDDTLCQGESIILSTATSADTYTWTGPNGFSSSSQSPPAITAGALTAGTYQLSVTVSGCGSADTSVLVVVNPLPATPVLAATENVCTGDSVVLTTTAVAPAYHWISPVGDTVTTTTNRLAIGGGLNYTSGNWSLITENSNGCSSLNSNVETVTILSIPTVVASNDGPVCLSSNVTLTGNTQPGGSYQWYDSAYTTLLATASSHVVNGLGAGFYTYNFIIDVNGCVDTASTIVQVDSLQQAPNIAVSNDTLCEGQTFSLTTTTSADTYTWTGPNGFSSGSQSPPAITAGALTAGTYQLSVTVTGCGSADTSVLIVVNPLPATPVLVATENVCSGDSVVLTTISTASSYHWISPVGDTVTTTTNRLAIGGGLNYTSGNWSLITENSNGCSSLNSNMETVTILSNPNAIALNDGPVCFNGTITLTGNTLPGASYLWYDSAYTVLLATVNTHMVSGLAGGLYTYNYIIDVNGCTDTASTIVQVDSLLPAPNISTSSDTLCVGQTFNLATSTSADVYLWSGPNGFSSNSQYPVAITANLNTAGTYQLYYIENGCESADTSITIVVETTPVTPVLVATNNLCIGDSIILTTTAIAPTYLWLSPIGDTVTTTVNRLAIGGGTHYISGNWSLVTVNINDCASLNSNIETVTLNSIPTAIASNNGPICLIGDVTLMGNTLSGASYQWYDSAYTTLLATSNSHVISGLSAGFYTYNYIINLNGCVDTSSTIVQVDSQQLAPNISVNDDTLCQGESIILSTATSADTYTWTGPNGFSSGSQSPPAITASALTAGTYQLSVTVSGCGSADTSVLVVVNPLPATPVLAATENVCTGDSVVLTTTAVAPAYHWISPVGDTVTTTTNRLAIGGGLNYTSGNWSLITENSNGCSSLNSNVETVTILSIPTVVASNDGPVCLSSNVTLTGNTQPGGSYQWYDSAYTTLLATASSHVVNGLGAGFYTYNFIIDVNGCVDTASTIVQVDSLQQAPNIAVSNDTLCEGQTFSLTTTTSADTYTWTGPSGFSSGSQSPPAITAGALTAGTYQLSVTVSGCGSADTSVLVVVNPLPATPVLVATENVCSGDSVVLTTISTASSYHWISPVGDTVTTTTNRLAIGGGLNYTSGNWSLITENSNGCVSSNSNIENVTIHNNPSAIAATDGPICLNGTLTLTGNTLPGATYEWYDSGYVTLLSTSNTHTISSMATGTYRYHYIINVNGCVDTANTKADVDSLQPAPGIYANDDTLCEGENISLWSTTIADNYSWTGPNGFSSADQYPASITANALTTGTYQLSVTVNGCSSADTSVLIVVNPLPAAPVLVATNNICDGDSVILNTTSSAPTYHWLSPIGDTVVTVINRLAIGGGTNYVSGNWSLNVINANGCTSHYSNNETVNIQSNPSAIASNDGPVCPGNAVTLTGNTETGANYQWYDSAFTALIATSSTHTVSGIFTGLHTFNYIINLNGCVDTASTTVQADSLQQAPSIYANDDTLCEGTNLILWSTTNADSYSWTGPNGFSSTDQYPASITADALTAGTYQLSVTVSGCGSADTSIVIVVDPLPATPVLVATNNVCNGDSVILSTIATASFYSWLSPIGDTVTTTTNRLAIGSGANYVSGNWSLATVNSNGCTSSSSNIASVNILSNPTAIASNDGPLCLNATLNLTGNTMPGATYEWYDSGYVTLLSTSNTHSISSMTAGTYLYHYIINVNGCVDTANTNAIVDSLQQAPSIYANDDTLCEGESISLWSTTNADSYSWTGPNGFSSTDQYPASITASTLTAGTYQLSVTVSGCGSADTSITIVVDPLPATPVLVATNTICDGDSVILSTTSSAPVYHWLSPIGDTVTTANNRLAIGGGTNYISGNWSLTTVNSNGCVSFSSNITSVNIQSNPSAIAANDGPICEGSAMTLTGNTLPGASYQWYDSTFTTLISTLSTYMISGVSTGSYTFNYIIDINGCVDTASTTVQVDSLPAAPVLIVNTPLCTSDTLFLSTDTADTYHWTGPHGFTSNLMSPVIPNADTINSGFYHLYITRNGCASPSVQMNVDVIDNNAVPNITSNLSTACEGELLIFNTSGFNGTNVSYVWYGPAGILDTTTNPTYIDSSLVIADSGEYFVEILIGTCTSLPSQIRLINVNPTPPTPDVTVDSPLCVGGFVKLTTNAIADQYDWKGPNGFTSNLKNPPVISPASQFDSGLYSLRIEKDGCFSQDSLVNVIVNAIPLKPFLYSNSPVCEDDTLVVYTLDTATNFIWEVPNSHPVMTSSDSLIIFPTGSEHTGTYGLILSQFGCTSEESTIEILIGDSTTAIAFAGDDIIVCEEAPSIHLDAIKNGAGFWNTQSSALIVTPSDPNSPLTNLKPDSVYTLTWTLIGSACGGSATDTIKVIVPSYPDAVFDTSTLTQTKDIMINVMTNDLYDLELDISIYRDPNSGIATTLNQQVQYENIELAYQDELVYEICLQECPTMCDTALVTINIDPLLNIPDIVTPNGNGSNETLVIQGLENFPSHELIIFNRWGNEVYFSDNYNNDWAGVFKGEELPDGTYFYVFINTMNGKTLKNGYITLHR